MTERIIKQQAKPKQKLSNTPKTCNCGTQFSVDHAMTCHMGGFPTICHNEICNITASLLTGTCHNVATEPLLQPLTGENLSGQSANTHNNACLDIRARGFWNNHQEAFFDVRVFYTNAPSNCSIDAYRKHEMSKKREYGQRYVRLSVECSPHLSSQLMVEWARKLLLFTGNLHT